MDADCSIPWVVSEWSQYVVFPEVRCFFRVNRNSGLLGVVSIECCQSALHQYPSRKSIGSYTFPNNLLSFLELHALKINFTICSPQIFHPSTAAVIHMGKQYSYGHQSMHTFQLWQSIYILSLPWSLPSPRAEVLDGMFKAVSLPMGRTH